MSAILSSRQTFLPEGIRKDNIPERWPWAYRIFWAFDRCCNANNDGDISISKFDLFCDLVTSSMTSWICIHIIVVIIWWYICTGSLMRISLLVVQLSWKMLLFHSYRNIEGRLWGHPVMSPMTSSSWKYFFWHNLGRFFARGQFWPSGIVIAPVCVYICQCVCVCVCINHLLVRTITHQPFKLESPNLKHMCKTPWLRCLLFLGVIDLELQGQI